jgi:hypothetical protein
MRANTVLKFGGLALDVAQDEKIRELATMIHKGAKRRGLFAPMPGPTQIPSQTAKSVPPRIPFAPATHAAPPSAQGASQSGPNLQKWLTPENAQKALSWAGMLKDVLLK